jgi:hypothetical protein
MTGGLFGAVRFTCGGLLWFGLEAAERFQFLVRTPERALVRRNFAFSVSTQLFTSRQAWMRPPEYSGHWKEDAS